MNRNHALALVFIHCVGNFGIANGQTHSESRAAAGRSIGTVEGRLSVTGVDSVKIAGSHTIVFVLPSPVLLKAEFERGCAGSERADSTAETAYAQKLATLIDPVQRAKEEGAYLLSTVQRNDYLRERMHWFFASYAIQSAATSASGVYRVSLPPGNYTLFAVLPTAERTYEWFIQVTVRKSKTIQRDLNEESSYTVGWSCEAGLPFLAR